MPDTLPPAPKPWQRLSVSIIAAMLLMTILMALSMVVVSDYSVKRQIAAMPPEWHLQLDPDSKQRQSNAGPGGASVAEATGGRVVRSVPQIPQIPDRPNGTARLTPPPRPSRTERFRRELLNNLLLAIVISGLGAVLVGAVLARRIAQPIDEVSRAAQLVASGDLSARARQLPGSAEIVSLTRHFNQMASSLDQLERERRDMIADIAHELRTPLAVVQARLDAFEDGILQPVPNELALIGAQIELLTRLVSDLRTLSLADAGRLPLQRLPLDLSALSGRIAQSYASKASASGRHLNTDLTKAELPVLADRDRLSQILINLLENAVRYTSSGTHITVQTRQEDLWAVLRVRDTGKGFDQGSLPHLFSRFYRADESRNRDYGGSGLGLAIVAVLVQAHGGQVHARNVQGGGAEVEIKLPLLLENEATGDATG